MNGPIQLRIVDRPLIPSYNRRPMSLGFLLIGLVAEDVEKVNPQLIVHDSEGKPFTVRYEAVNTMLLNEFLKEHRKVEQLESNATEQEKEIKALAAAVEKQAFQIQKVTAQFELNKAAPQTVARNP
jgi:uncharacterized coiled-coil protein SlyX